MKIDDTPWAPPFELNGMKVVYDPAEAARRLEGDTVVGFDTETTGLSAWRSNLACMQFYGRDTGTLALIRTWGGEVPDPLKELLSRPGRLFVGHNIANFDIQFLQEAGVAWEKADWWDTLVAECIVTTAGRKDVSMSLKNALRRRLAVDIDKEVDHGSWGSDFYTPEMVRYAVTDVALLPALYDAQLARAAETEQLDALRMEESVMPVYARMVCNGLPVFPESVQEYLSGQREEAAALEERLRTELGLGEEINLDSPAQLRERIKAVTGIPILGTSKEVLTTYAEQDNLLGDISATLLRWKEPRQRIKMYGAGWVQQHVDYGWVHPKIWQAKTDTTRSSSSDPNFQQVPKDGRCIVGGLEGWSIVSTDLSQIELRVSADLANARSLIAMLDHDDVHSAVGAMMYKVHVNDVSKAQRRAAKGCSFALLYDGSAKTLYRTTKLRGGGISLREAYDMEQKWFSAFPELWAAKEKARAMARKSGPVFIRLANGTRRMLVGPDKKASTILNTLSQGNAAVCLKLGIREAHRRGLSFYMGLPVHDEIVSCVPDGEAKEFAREMEDSLVYGCTQILQVPCKADSTIGLYWS